MVRDLNGFLFLSFQSALFYPLFLEHEHLLNLHSILFIVFFHITMTLLEILYMRSNTIERNT